MADTEKEHRSADLFIELVEAKMRRLRSDLERTATEAARQPDHSSTNTAISRRALIERGVIATSARRRHAFSAHSRSMVATRMSGMLSRSRRHPAHRRLEGAVRGKRRHLEKRPPGMTVARRNAHSPRQLKPRHRGCRCSNITCHIGTTPIPMANIAGSDRCRCMAEPGSVFATLLRPRAGRGSTSPTATIRATDR